ncbi:MAG: hypothetical protein LBC57_09985, partial [Treponema sp.]|nr:hypothetical protein [Treponema sp.]
WFRNKLLEKPGKARFFHACTSEYGRRNRNIRRGSAQAQRETFAGLFPLVRMGGTIVEVNKADWF